MSPTRLPCRPDVNALSQSLRERPKYQATQHKRRRNPEFAVLKRSGRRASQRTGRDMWLSAPERVRVTLHSSVYSRPQKADVLFVVSLPGFPLQMSEVLSSAGGIRSRAKRVQTDEVWASFSRRRCLLFVVSRTGSELAIQNRFHGYRLKGASPRNADRCHPTLTFHELLSLCFWSGLSN